MQPDPTHHPGCFACRDFGLAFEQGRIATCWRKRAGADHAEPNAAALIAHRAIEHAQIQKLPITEHTFNFVRDLCRYTANSPARREVLIERHFSWSSSATRLVADMIETLRKQWLMPIGARKEGGGGYWIITTEADYREWFEHAAAAPKTQLATIWANARRNFPELAGQLALEFGDPSAEPEMEEAA
ncbi:MAG: hypothetical protein R2682_01860 [Pyrinomonadaceae bacterium]